MPQTQQTFTMRICGDNSAERTFKQLVFFRHFPAINVIVVGQLQTNRNNLLIKQTEVVEIQVSNVIWYEFNILEIGN